MKSHTVLAIAFLAAPAAVFAAPQQQQVPPQQTERTTPQPTQRTTPQPMQTQRPMRQQQRTQTIQSPVPSFESADKNGDGKVEWKEAQVVGVPKATFDKFDFNKQGSLSQAQWKAVRRAVANSGQSDMGH